MQRDGCVVYYRSVVPLSGIEMRPHAEREREPGGGVSRAVPVAMLA